MVHVKANVELEENTSVNLSFRFEAKLVHAGALPAINGEENMILYFKVHFIFRTMKYHTEVDPNRLSVSNWVRKAFKELCVSQFQGKEKRNI